MRWLTSALSMMLAVLLLPTDAHANSPGVRVSLRMPDVLIVRYLPELAVRLSDTGEFSSHRTRGVASTGGEGTTGVVVHVGAKLVAQIANGASEPNVSGELGGVFSVMGTSPSGRLQVSTIVEQGTGFHADGGSLHVAQATAVIGGKQGVSVTLDAPGVGSWVNGGLGLDLDLAEARSAGSYRGITLRLRVEQL